MRRRGFWLGATFLVMACGLFACTSEQFEARETVDGAAGSSGAAGAGGMSEGGAGDAGVDAPGDAYVPVLETVVVTNGEGSIIANADVFSSSADGSLFATAKTDATGTASIDVPPGGSVSSILTRVDPGGNGTALKLHILYSIAEVEQGSTVQLVSFKLQAPPTPPTMADITLTLASVPSGTASVKVFMPCAAPAEYPESTIVVKDYAACPGESTYDVVALALNAAGVTLGSAFVLEKAFTAGQTASHTLSFSSAAVQTTASIEGLPTNADYALLSLSGWRPQRPSLRLSVEQGHTEPPDTSVSSDLMLPGGLPLAFAIREEVQWHEGDLTFSAIRNTPTSTLPAASTWSLPSSLAAVSGVGAPDLSDIARPKFAWQLSDGDVGACAVLSAQAKRSDNEIMMWVAVTKAAKDGNWQIPELPRAMKTASLPSATP